MKAVTAFAGNKQGGTNEYNRKIQQEKNSRRVYISRWMVRRVHRLWRTCRVFNKVDGCSWVGDWANFRDVPETVYSHFNKIADYEDVLYIEGRTA